MVPLNGIKAVRNFCPDCLLNTEISRLSSFAIPFPLLYSRGLIKAPMKSVPRVFSGFNWPKKIGKNLPGILYTLVFLGCVK